MQKFQYKYFDEDKKTIHTGHIEAVDHAAALEMIKSVAPENAYDYELTFVTGGSLKDPPTEKGYTKFVVEFFLPENYTQTQFESDLSDATEYWSDGGPLIADRTIARVPLVGPKDSEDFWNAVQKNTDEIREV